MKAQTAPSAAGWLRRIPAFSELTDEQLHDLGARCELRAFRSGATIVSAGQWRGAAVVLSGSVRLMDERTPGRAVAIDTLSPGAVFGQESLDSAGPFPHDAFASGDSSILLLAKDAWDAWIASRESVARDMRQRAARQALLEFLAGTPVSSLGAAEMARLADGLREFQLLPGEVLVPARRVIPEFYIVREGRLRIAAGDRLSYATSGVLIGSLWKATEVDDEIVAETDCCVYAFPLARRPESVAERDEAAVAEPSVDSAADSEPAADANLRWKEPLYTPPRRWLRKRQPAVRQQSAMDCGAACLATVCRYYGKRISLNRLRELARVGSSGASMLHILKAAQQLGFETAPMLATVDHLRANHLPAIVNWKGYHWIVVYGVGERSVRVADPAGGLQTLPLDVFEKAWTRYTLYLRPTQAFADLAETPPTLQQFAPYLRPHRRTLFEIGLASLAIQVLALLLPIFTQFTIDEVIVRQHTQWQRAALIAISVATMARWAVSCARQNLLLVLAKTVNVRLLGDFYRHVLSLPLPFFERRKVGDVISRLEENVKITAFFTHTGLDVFIDATMAALYLALMVHYNPRLTAVCAGFLLLHVLNVYLITPRLQNGFREAFERGAALQSHTIEALTGARTIRTLGIEHYVRWTWENLFARFTNAYFRTLKYTIASGLFSQFLSAANNVTVLFYGAHLVLRNELTIGGLLAFTVLQDNLMAPVIKLVGSWDNLQETLNSVERLNDVYETAPEAGGQPGGGAVDLPPLNGHIRFEDVTFRYDPEGRNVLQNITLEIHIGQRVAFVGRSGSGKSTLVKLLLGFYGPTAGRVLVDGFDISGVWLPSLRTQIGVVPQESFLFRGTIHENIARGRPDASPADVEWAARLADAHDFISRLPAGYDTALAEQGSNLSGGQRQRVAIARAILQRPRMLLLDEATSALDNESERRFMQNLDQAFPNCTTLLIAHRLSTVRNADLIVVLDQGNIVERGTHDELMRRRGLYYFLSTQQLNL